MGGIEQRSYANLSRCMSHALRHEPWIYELELDDEGWASVEVLLESLRTQRQDWNELEVSDFERVIERSSKKRHEIRGNLIRALYGHSTPQKLRKTPATPPKILYHGTAPEMVTKILAEGLQPMERQYVHLSVDKGTAIEVGRRKSVSPVILVIDTKKSDECGTVFYEGNEKVWLADEIPPALINVLP